MKHMVHRYLRKPVAALPVPSVLGYGLYDGTLVICDDGATFFSWPDGDRPRTWVEGSPIPGTVRDMNLKDPVGKDTRPAPKKRRR